MTSASATSPFTLKWGILATGWIAEKFSIDLLLDPATRDVSDVRHQIVAAASSTSSTRAQEFLAKVGADTSGARAYGSYEELVNDANVDIVYVATPHSHHYRNVLLALNAGKHVCCEKAFTINARQAEHLYRVAGEKKLFLMEAVWVRFFPITRAVQHLIHEERRLGRVRRVFSDFGMQFEPDPNHRLLNPHLGGGALLDLGIYALTWQMLILYAHPDNHGASPRITSSMLKSQLTGVDEFTTIILDFPQLQAQGVATTNMSIRTSDKYCVLVQGDQADLTIPWAPFRPTSYVIHEKDKDGAYTGKKEEKQFDIPGHGMFWEADACARAIQNGKLEEKTISWNESTLIMQIMDQVRANADFKYPDDIEAVLDS